MMDIEEMKKMTPYEVVCRIQENNRRILECEKAIEDIEALGRLLFRLQNNDVIREKNLSSMMYEENQKFYQAIGKLSRIRADLQAENGDLHWNLKYVKEVPVKTAEEPPAQPRKGRGRPRKE